MFAILSLLVLDKNLFWNACRVNKNIWQVEMRLLRQFVLPSFNTHAVFVLPWALATRTTAMLLALLLFIALPVYAAGQFPGLDNCLACLCSAATDCNLRIGCEKATCGMFQITKPYWVDGGLNTIDGKVTDKEDMAGYQRCSLDLDCSAKTIRGYFEKYQKDCNGNGEIDCEDLALIHHLGPSCTNKYSEWFLGRFRTCRDNIFQLYGKISLKEELGTPNVEIFERHGELKSN